MSSCFLGKQELIRDVGRGGSPGANTSHLDLSGSLLSDRRLVGRSLQRECHNSKRRGLTGGEALRLRLSCELV